MVAKCQLVLWSYVDGADRSDSERFVPGDPSLWKVIEDNVGILNFSMSEGLLVDWGDSEVSVSDEQWLELLGFPGICEVTTTDSVGSFAIQIRTRSKIADDVTSMLHSYLSLYQKAMPKLVQKIRVINVSGAKAGKSDALKLSLEKLIQFGGKSGIYDPLLQNARLVETGAVTEWPFSSASDDNEALSFLDNVRAAQKHPLSAKYIIKEIGSKIKEGELHTSFSPLDLLDMSSSQSRVMPEGLDPLTLILGLQARHTTPYSKIVHRELESIAAFRERGVSLAYSTELHPFSSFVEIFDGFQESYLHNFIPSSSTDYLYVIRPVDSRNSYEFRKLERMISQIKKIEGAHSHLLALEYGLCLGVAKIAAKISGITLFDVVLKQLAQWDQQSTGYERSLIVWVPEASKKKLEKLARQYGISALICGRLQEQPVLSVVAENGSSQDIDVSLLIDALQGQADFAVMGSWAYEDDRRPAYGFERANIYPDRFLMRSTQKNKPEMEVGNSLSSYFAGDLSRVSLQRGSFSYPLGALRWSDGFSTFIEAGGQTRGISRYNPRLMGVNVVDEAVRWLATQGSIAEGAMGAVFVSMPTADLQELNARQRGMLALAFDGMKIACKQYGIKIANVRFAPHSGPTQQFELIFRISKSIDPKINFTIPGFRMEDEVLYAVGPKPPFVDSGSKILPYVRVASNHVTELNLASQLELYKSLVKCIEDSVLSSMRPISTGGIAEALGEMALWSGMGAKIKPSVPTIEIFSAAPGRFIVGVLPQFTRTFESIVPSELFTHLGTSGGNKVLSLPLTELFDSRKELASPREDVV